jgi:septation ring formation regulator EzrA
MNVNKYIKGYVNVNKDLHKSDTKSIDNNNEINYIKNTKKAAKKEITMTKNINTRLNELTEAVKMILNHIDVLEERITNDKKMVIKPLKGATKKVEKEIKTVANKVAVVKKATKKRDPKVVKLQKQAREMKSNMTKDQLSNYKKLWSMKWQYVNKTIDIKNKDARSLAFAKGRIECAKKAMARDI